MFSTSLSLILLPLETTIHGFNVLNFTPKIRFNVLTLEKISHLERRFGALKRHMGHPWTTEISHLSPFPQSVAHSRCTEPSARPGSPSPPPAWRWDSALPSHFTASDSALKVTILMREGWEGRGVRVMVVTW